jgi:hypothetical protein
MPTHTLTALYSDPGTAERAADLLRAIGVAEDALEIHPEADGGMPAGGPIGILNIANPLMPRDDAAAEVENARTVLVATRVSEELIAKARSILREEAVEVDDDRDAS